MKTRLPKIINLLLLVVLPSQSKDHLYGDFEHLYNIKVERDGKHRANLWLLIQIIINTPGFLQSSFRGDISMLQNYLRTAYRNLVLNKWYSLINISGLALGIFSLLIIWIYINHEKDFDSFHKNLSNIFRVDTEIVWDGQKQRIPITQCLLAPNMKDDFPGIIRSARMKSIYKKGVRYNDKNFLSDDLRFVDPDFIEMFSFKVISGDKKSLLTNKNSIVLTEDLAVKYFGTEEPIGKTLILDKVPLTVTGVLENPPANSTLQFSGLIEFETYKIFDNRLDDWGRFDMATFIQTTTESNSILQSKLNGYMKKFSDINAEYQLQPFGEIHLNEFDEGKGLRNLFLLGSIALLILFTASVNFINLSTARANKRSKEIGVRKSIGAQRIDLIKQYLSESILMSVIATTISIILVVVLLPYVSIVTDSTISLDLSFRHIIAVIGIALFVGIISGLYPAFYLSSFKPVEILKNNSFRGRFSKFSVLLRKVLSIGQFIITISLITFTLVIINQIEYVKNTDLGYSTNHKIFCTLPSDYQNQYEVIKNELSEKSFIKNITRASAQPYDIGNWTTMYKWTDQSSNEEFKTNTIYCDIDYINSMNIKMLIGRNFSHGITSDTINAVVINKSAMDKFGWNDINEKYFNMWGIERKVIGVTDNFKYHSMHESVTPLIFVPEAQRSYFVFFTIDSHNINESISDIKNIWKAIVPEVSFDYSFLDEKIELLYKPEINLMNLLAIFSLFAVFIASLGLFGLVTLSSELKVKEIGIRKVLGASISGLFFQLSKNYFLWIGAAATISFPISYYFSKVWLNNFAYRIDLDWKIYSLTILIALSVCLFTISLRLVKSVTANPVQSLKQE